MIEKTKRGNGSSFIPYLHYINHVQKVVNSNPIVDTSTPQVMGHYKFKLEMQNQKNHLKRDQEISKENMRIFHKINEVVENEKVPHLQQFGPKSLNFVSKKNVIKKIIYENQLLKSKIHNAQSYVTKQDLQTHQAKLDRHKKILMESSPSTAKLDPLINKHLKSRSNLMLNSSSRKSLGGLSRSIIQSPSALNLTLQQMDGSQFTVGNYTKRNLSQIQTSPREALKLTLPDINSSTLNSRNVQNLHTVVEDKFESTQQNYNQGGLLNLKSYGGKRSGSQTVDYSSLYNQLGAQYNQEQAFQQQQINLNSDNSQSKLSRFKSNRGSSIQYQQNQAISANLDLDRMIQMKINSRNFKGDYVPARQRKSLSNSALTKGKNTYMFNGPALDIADLVQIKIRQPSREEFVDNLQQQNLGKMNYTDIKNMLVRNDNDRNNSGLQAQPFYTIQ